MSRIDESKQFIPVRIAVLTVSDTRAAGRRPSGETLVDRIAAAGHVLADRAIVRDERAEIADQLRAWCADPDIDVVISTGGTGLTGRDVTVEAHRDVYEKEIEAFGTVFTIVSMQKIGTCAVQSRATGGRGAGHLPVRAARQSRRLQGRLGRDPGAAARLPAPALQLRRDFAASGRTSATEIASSCRNTVVAWPKCAGRAMLLCPGDFAAKGL